MSLPGFLVRLCQQSTLLLYDFIFLYFTYPSLAEMNLNPASKFTADKCFEKVYDSIEIFHCDINSIYLGSTY